MPSQRRRGLQRDDVPGTTPLRTLAQRRDDGCLTLADRAEQRFLDGSEARVLGAVTEASDVTSMSGELASVTTWPDRYHLSHARANVVRAFDLPADARVLEVGAGCGAISRLLGERCALVDSLEPVAERAAVARRRTADLGTVEVIVGSVADLPRQATYDLIVVVGVLEYAGGGLADRAPHLDFLTGLHDALQPGGSLILAIENRLGVKYLAGSPEDHTWRTFESVEGYRYGDNRARTFSRVELDALFVDAGLRPRIFGAFPDYKFSRAILSDTLLEQRAPLAWRLPGFPSAELRGERPHGLAEGPLWEELVRAGCAADFSNSFVVLASRDDPRRQLWPDDQLACLYHPQRQPRYAQEMRLLARDGGWVMQRRQLVDAATAGPLQHRVNDEPVVPGTPMLELLQRARGSELEELLHRWARAVVERVSFGEPAPIDCIPQNVIVDEGGALHFIDDEWHAPGWDLDDVVARGALRTGLTLAETTPPARWTGIATVEALVLHVGGIVGLLSSDRWLQRAVRREAMLQAEIVLAPQLPAGVTAAEAFEQGMLRQLAAPLSTMPLGERSHDQLAYARRVIAELEHEVAAQRATLDTLHTQKEAADEQARRVITSVSWRATRVPRGMLRAARRMLRPQQP